MKYVAIFSVPRSGSSWLGEIFNSSPNTIYRFQPNFAYTFPLTLRKESPSYEINNFHRELLDTNDPFVTNRLSISGKEKIMFNKKNQNLLVWKETHFIFLADSLLRKSDMKIIGLIRSPFSTIYSWSRIPKEFHPDWELSEQWRFATLKNKKRESHYFGFEKWKRAALLFEKLKLEFPDRLYIVNYNDLLKNTLETVSNLFSFADLEVSRQTLDFIKESRKSTDGDAYSVYRDKTDDDDWRGNLSHSIINGIKTDHVFLELNNRYHWI